MGCTHRVEFIGDFQQFLMHLQPNFLALEHERGTDIREGNHRKTKGDMFWGGTGRVTDTRSFINVPLSPQWTTGIHRGSLQRQSPHAGGCQMDDSEIPTATRTDPPFRAQCWCQQNWGVAPFSWRCMRGGSTKQSLRTPLRGVGQNKHQTH